MTNFASFERLKAKAVTHYKDGEYRIARSYFLDAAECLVALAESTKSDETRRQHEEIAAELIDLAKDCDRYSEDPKSAPKRAREKNEDDDASNADEWIVSKIPDIGFDDIAGLEDVKADIRLKMIYPLSHPELAQKYGIPIGGGVLLYGPPGTGKTMMAKAIAHELKATFFLISPAQILSKWVGEAEQNIKKLFDAARDHDSSIIFIDECEALVPKRGSGSSTVMQRVVPQILQELEGFDRESDRAILFVGATNKPWMLDDAMLRPGRLDTKIYVGLPDSPARFRLLEIYFSKKPLDEDVDFSALTDRLEGYTGADIKSIAQRAAAIPFTDAIGGREPRPISMEDITAVIESTPPSVDPASLVRYERFAETGVKG
jgi:transitional endoplasmic reticulum ATPase